MKTKLLTLVLLVFCTAGFYSCSDDDDEAKKTDVTITVANPTDLADMVTGKWTITLTERNTNRKYIVEGNGNTFSTTIPEGDYKITGECPITYTFTGKTLDGALYISEDSKIVIGNTVTLALTSFPRGGYNGDNGGFVIEEIFYRGTATPEGKAYSGDKYIKLYNNTDKTLYADGLFLATTQRNTSIAYTYNPEIIATHVPVTGVIVIPGNGTQYPVEPGKSFILTESAIDHKSANRNSFDLTVADMEWRNDHLINQPANNPNVPDATLVCDFFSLHMNGLTSIIMGRLEVSTDKFLADYAYEYTWKTVFNGTEYERGPFVDYKIPNEWVMDAVYTSVEGKADVPVFSPTLDMGWTYCGASFNDPLSYGTSVRRKVLSTTDDGRNILKDTNNSAVDFTPSATPSLAK